jgi:hypothetical protein
MSQDWNTKYGPRRVRRDPPTLEEAIFAAAGITEDQSEQAEIAASLMGMPIETVIAEVRKAGRVQARTAWSNVAWYENSATTSGPAPKNGRFERLAAPDRRVVHAICFQPYSCNKNFQ